jgi:glycosyltransferase involved in cell wall biosynthesis
VKYLFAHQNFPGQFLHITRHLAASRDNDIVFISEPNQNHLSGVRKIPYVVPPPNAVTTHVIARDLDAAGRRAEAVASTAERLKALGFEPDIIIGHHGWGELLNLPDVWPGVPLLGYMEFFYQIRDVDVGFDPEFPTPVSDYPRIRAKNATNLLALNLRQHGFTPTRWQLSTYPAWAQERITLLPEGVDLEACKPDPREHRQELTIGGITIGKNEKLVTYVARDLEPYRGFHIMMRALPHLLRARRDVRVVMIGGDAVSYGAPPRSGTWRELMCAELGDAIDPKRVVFPGRVDYQIYLRLLRRSDAHVYLTYPFVASWSLRESLAAGCAVIGSDTQPVREFIEDGRNGVLAPFFDAKGLALRIQQVLEDTTLSRRLREGARTYAERHLSLSDTLRGYEALIGRLTNGGRLDLTSGIKANGQPVATVRSSRAGPRAPVHLSRPAGEVGSRSEPGEGLPARRTLAARGDSRVGRRGPAVSRRAEEAG